MNTMQRSFVYGVHSITKNKSVKDQGPFSGVISELKKREEALSTDVATLRAQIELASLDITEAQKRLRQSEKDFAEAKANLFVKEERKEQLTALLCELLKQNELEKAQTISDLVEKLELPPCPSKMMAKPQEGLEQQNQSDTYEGKLQVEKDSY